MAEHKQGDLPYWNRQPDELMHELGSSPGGLSSAAAAELFRTVGPNSVQDVTRLDALRLLLRQFESPLVLILVFGALISLLLRQWVDATIILAIVVGSTLLGFFQEYRASTAVEELKRRLALSCRVLRDGAAVSLPVTELVPGDVVQLAAGSLIPVDGLVLEARDFLVSESSLTGESFPVEKRPGIVTAEAPIGARTNAVFLGSSVRSGTATVLAVATGRRTAFGAIAGELATRRPETDFAHGVRQFGYLLMRVMILMVLFVLTVNLLQERPLIESLLFAVALAVGLSPELLPAIVSVTLSAGARAMSKQGVIVRRLEAIENLGSMSILCTDKTGTLTEGTIVLKEACDCTDRPSASVLRLAHINALLESGIENPLDAAIVEAGRAAGLTAGGTAKIDEIPYDFLRRRLTIVVAENGDTDRHLIITKGAFANVIETCRYLQEENGQVELSPPRRAALAAIYQAKGEAGYRVLALATRRVAAKPAYDRDDERDMVLQGLLVFYDPPKPEAERAIHDLAALGIRIKIISGDNRFVTAHLARSVGLDPKSMITGEQLGALKNEALWHLAPRTDLFVEIDPQQKERIVRALQHAGHSVGYLGDGVNDAPALHAADVGVSVEQAVDVARESADIILLRRDLDVLRAGVENGRRTFANTLKYISITTSANFGNMVSMALAAPLLPFLPLVAKQILLNNFLSDLPSIAISNDNVDAEQVTRPQRWSIKDIRNFMIRFGLISSAFDVLTFGLLMALRADEATFQTAWFLVSLLTELAVVLVLRTRRPAFASRPGWLLLVTTLVVAAASLAIPYLDGVSALFGFLPLGPLHMATVIGIVVAYVAVTEIAKRIHFGVLQLPRKARAAGPPR